VLKIALVHNHVGGPGGGGGGVRQMLELGLALDELGHQVVVLCHDFEPGTEFGGASGRLEVRAVRRGPVRHPVGQREVSARLFRGMASVAKLVPPDVDAVNAHEWPALHAGRLAARRARAPFVWTRNDETMWERGLIPDETIVAPPRRRGRLAHLALALPDFLDARRAARIVVLDSRNARMVRRAYRRKAAVIRSGPASHFFDAPAREEARRQLGVAAGDFLVLGVAILYPHRRFEDLIEASALVDEDASVRTLIVGSDHGDPGYADLLERLIEERGLRTRVRLTRSGLSDDELRLHYAAADVFVFPNRRQTWGLAPLEALAARTPAVVSRGAGVHEVLEGRPGVVVVPAEDPQALAEALAAVRHDGAPPGLEETRAWIRAELGSRRYAEQMAALFAEIV
jgi:glycosyltransferase involved in cell wall biosynthesis